MKKILNRKNLVFLFSVACIIFCVLAFVPNIIKGYAQNSISKPVFQKVELNEKYYKNEIFVVPECKCEQGQEEYKADFIVYFPNGDATTQKEFLLRFSGKYVVEYNKTISGVRYASRLEFFVGDPLYDVQTDGDTVGAYNNSLENAGVEAHLRQGDKLVFNKAVNFEQMDASEPFLVLNNDPNISPIGLKEKLFSIKENVTDTAEEFNVSRGTIYHYLDQNMVVYGIISEGIIKYIGSTKNYEERKKQHILKRPFLTPSNFVILKQITENDRFTLERELIHIIQPEWNIMSK